MGEEQRRYVRWKEKVKVDYALPGKNEAFQETFTEDISESGMQLLAEEQLELQRQVKLRLEFVFDSVPIVLDAKVTYLTPYKNRYRVGLEFSNMDSFQKQRLIRSLEKIKQGVDIEE